MCHRFMRPASTVSHCMDFWISQREQSCFGLTRLLLFRAFAAAVWTWAFGKQTEYWSSERDHPISSPSAGRQSLPGQTTHNVARPTVFALLRLFCVVSCCIWLLGGQRPEPTTGTQPVAYAPYTHIRPDTSDFSTGCPPVGVPTLLSRPLAVAQEYHEEVG
jgi:hypothetical protein